VQHVCGPKRIRQVTKQQKIGSRTHEEITAVVPSFPVPTRNDLLKTTVTKQAVNADPPAYTPPKIKLGSDRKCVTESSIYIDIDTVVADAQAMVARMNYQ
jgi:hypothetical protein